MYLTIEGFFALFFYMIVTINLVYQLDAIGQIADGPVIGVIGTLVSIRAALVSTAALLSPTLLLFVRADSQGKKVDSK